MYYFCFWLCWVFAAVHEFSLVLESRDYTLVAVHQLLIAAASLVAEHGSSMHRFQQLQHMSSVVVAPGL